MAFKRKSKHSRLTRKQKEKLVQEYYACGVKRTVYKKYRISPITLDRVLREAEEDPTLQAVRARSIDELSGQMHKLAEETIQSIRPEHLETKKHYVRNANGDLVRIVEEGPSLRDKTYLFTSIVDRISVLDAARDHAKGTDKQNDELGSMLLLPETVEASRQALLSGIKSIRALHVEFRTGETGKKISMDANRLGIAEQEIALAEDAPFDNL